MATQSLVLVVVTGTIGLAAAVLLFTTKHRIAAALGQQDDGVRNDQSVLDSWENEGGTRSRDARAGRRR